MNEATQKVLDGLQLDRSPSDSVRAQVLAAIIAFAREVGDADLSEGARAKMPAANPFRPPPEWKERYLTGLEEVADEDCGVYFSEDGERYSVEYWQSFSDEQRAARLADPELGYEDGQTDGTHLNGPLPTSAWILHYLRGVRAKATDSVAESLEHLGQRHAITCWQAFTDEERSVREGEPEHGYADGRDDAARLNAE
ncbi:hypothetical protein F6X40_11425 [Paraburkholderia sp. UCT31]|uniref:hypothetical protein n=1 Tax=Paraburkholderia sp. UCT31 TaxID=2615209 RepID=UPI00165631AB|nr:hypothetical protein [Paraburkholderia sp. UCT31]MBC8737415.1 hypothetical protein [Paraburkholderia sp. UCT31]